MPKKIQYFQIGWDRKQVETKSDGTLSIRGMASTKDLDRYNDIVEPTAFTHTLEVFAKNPIMLLQHDSNKPIGRFSEATITNGGLEVLGEVIYDEDDCIQKIQDGILGAFSIGYFPKRYEIRNSEGKLLATESGYEEGVHWEDVWLDSTAVRTIKELDLVEISIVSTPANPHAVFSLEKSVKSFFEDEKKHWKELIESKDSESSEASDEPNDADTVANDILKQEEVSGETPETPEAPADETDGDGETPEEHEEKGLVRKEIKDLVGELKTIKDSIESYKGITSSLVSIVESQKVELGELKNLIASLPMRKGLVNNLGSGEQKGYITSLLAEAQKHL